MGDQVSIQGNGYVNNCFTSWLLCNLNILSLQPCFKDFKTNGDAGNVRNVRKCSQIYLQNTPKELLFQKVQPDLEDRALSLAHSRLSIYSMYLPSPQCQTPETSTFKCMYYQLKCTTAFFLMQEAFQDHTALQLAMEWVMRVYSSHWYQPQSFALLFLGVKFAIFMFKYYNMVLQNKFQPDVDRKYDSPEWGQRQTYNPQVGYLWWLVRVFVLWRQPLMFCPTI